MNNITFNLQTAYVELSSVDELVTAELTTDGQMIAQSEGIDTLPALQDLTKKLTEQGRPELVYELQTIISVFASVNEAYGL